MLLPGHAQIALLGPVPGSVTGEFVGINQDPDTSSLAWCTLD